MAPRSVRALPLLALALQAGTAAADDLSYDEYCPGALAMKGIHRKHPGKVSDVHLIPTGWTGDVQSMAKVIVHDEKLTPEMDSRAYFAHQCIPGKYSNKDYVNWNLLGRRMKFTANLKGTGCGCNVAFYLVSMRQNAVESECKDYYCDANSVCGVACAEIDIMEANEHAWHTTLHTQLDHNGMAGGLGGGDGWNGPRDWKEEEYSPGGRCVDTNFPFNVSVEFPTDERGVLVGMKVRLSQDGRPCAVGLELSEYAGLGTLTEALKDGMTPVVSYWSSDKMLWLDGDGTDNKGPCHKDKPASCPAVAKLSNFELEHLSAQTEAENLPEGGAAGGAGHERLEDFEDPTASPAKEATCPGKLGVEGSTFGEAVHLIPTGWGLKDQKLVDIKGDTLITNMGSRAYFAEQCTAGTYSNEQYTALKLLGKTLHFDVDLSTTDCGCNSAMYLVSMRQNDQRSDCDDYYCDANSVCGIPCPEIDIMEANKHAWHSTLHTQFDHDGQAAGLGGGAGWNGPRDFTKEEYGPGGSCIDTTKEFHVAASFPVDGDGLLTGMHMSLNQTQSGKACALKLSLENYEGLADLTGALRDGMTPVVSYWNSREMLWLDGEGMDKRGGCGRDDPSKCGDQVAMRNFKITVFDTSVAPPAHPASEGTCEHGWMLRPECVSEFKYLDKTLTGCTEEGSVGRPWCSHDATYQNKYSMCEPCRIQVGDRIEPLFPTEDVIMREDAAGNIEEHRRDNKDDQTGAEIVLAEPFERCGRNVHCVAGYYCQHVNKWWAQCTLIDTEDPVTGCINDWKPHEDCVKTFTFDDFEYVGCTGVSYKEGHAWCSTSALYKGSWKECTKCEVAGNVAMKAEELHLEGLPAAGAALGTLGWVAGAAAALALLGSAALRLRSQHRRDVLADQHQRMLPAEDQEVGAAEE